MMQADGAQPAADSARPARETPPPVQAAGPRMDAAEPDAIEVVGRRRDQTVKVDRRTYLVSKGAHAARKNALDLVRGLPTVTVTPADSIHLLGSGNVTVLVDGRPYQGNLREYLLSLHGSDIAQIEVMTNPSAQYSAEGTGGIVNFVLRSRTAGGLAGTASGYLTSIGRAASSATFKYGKHKLGAELQVDVDSGITGRTVGRTARSTMAAAAALPVANTIDARDRSWRSQASLGATIRYDVDARNVVSIKTSVADQSDRGRARFR